MSTNSFNCYLVQKDDRGQVTAQVAKRNVSDLPPGDVLVRVAYSSLNYKDALSATGHPGVTRKFPHVPGIDAAGTVVESKSPNWREGDEVLITGHDLGQNTWGGFAEFVRVPAAWIVRRPAGLSLRECMIYGTAGFTAGMSMAALADHGIVPERGEIAVTGASGGVGSLAVAILARAGYQVAASTGKEGARQLLMALGAKRIVSRNDVHDESTKPLLAPAWAGAVDTVGGKTLATLVRATAHDGCITACGLVGGTDLNLTVYPFILRGVTLAGIDSAECPRDRRLRVWQKLASDWKPANLEVLVTEVNLSGLDAKVKEILAGQVVGRVLVKPTV